ncbi:MAG: CotH kinase family protein [Actinomycetes bacterium]
MSKVAVIRRLAIGLIATLSVLSSISGSANAAAPLTLTDIYNPSKVIRIDFNLPADSVSSLNNQDSLETYVPGTVTLSLGTKTSGAQDIHVRLKGSTSLQKLDWTPSFKIKFKKGPTGLGYLGLRRMTLNAMTQDDSKLHEFGAYALFNAIGVPASKTGWARIYVNGKDKGLYINIETPDETFMARRFKDITQHVYEGAGSDFYLGSDTGDNKTGAFLVDAGWKVTPNKYDLNTLISYTYLNDPASWYAGLLKVTDRAELIKFFAVENFIGHWDGYSGPDKNNYFIRSNTQGKFTFIPWGADQTFGENRWSPLVGDTFDMPMLSDRSDQPWVKDSSRGKIYVQCINNKACKIEYLKALKAVSAKVASIQLGAKIATAAKVIEPVLQSQYGTDLGTMKYLNDIHTEQNRTIWFIANRRVQVSDLLKQNGIK